MDIIEKISAITKLVSGIENHEIYDKLGDLQISAYELKTQILELKEENRLLKEQLSDKAIKKTVKETYFFGEEGPYCTCCYDNDNKKILLHKDDNYIGYIYYECPECKTRVLESTYDFTKPKCYSKAEF